MATGTVAVVGAGLAGLAATTELSRRGYRVELFERTRLLGGKATSFTVNGNEIDNGQHVFLACCSDWLDFVAQLGLSDQLYLQPRFEVLLLLKNGAPRRLRAARAPAPAHLLPVLLRYPGISLGGKTSLVAALRRVHRSIDPQSTFSQWLDEHHQDQATRRNFWEPFIVPALNARLDEVSAEAALFVIKTAFLDHASNGRIGYARVPLARVAARAAESAARVHLRTPVTGLSVDHGDVMGIQLEGGRRLDFDAVILAVPPAALRRLLGEPDRFGISGLGALQTRAIVDVHLWYEGLDFPFDFAAVLDSPIQWVFRKAPAYLVCSLSSADALVGWTEEELVHLAETELRAVLPQLRSRSVARAVATRDRDATFIPTPGIRRPGPATTVRNLAIAGAWTDTGWPATMESAVRSGRAAARLVAGSEVQRAA